MSTPQRSSRKVGLSSLPRPESAAAVLVANDDADASEDASSEPPASRAAASPRATRPAQRSRAAATTAAAPKRNAGSTKTFLLHMPEELHRELKLTAVAGGTTMHDLVMDAIRASLSARS